MKLINKHLVKFLSIAVVFSTAVSLLTYKFWPVLTHNTIYYCRSFLNGSLIKIPHVFHQGAIIFISILFIAIIARLMFVIAKSSKFKKHLLNRSENSKKLVPILRELKLIKKVTVVKDQSPFAFCLGIKNSHIYISTRTIKMMTVDELKAILIHEKYHLDKKDGLIMQIASLTKIIFPLFPAISDLIQGYKLDREIKADKEVISKLGEKPLISVLTKLLTFPSVPMLTASYIADTDTVESRIKAISLNQNSNMKFNKINLLISLITLAFFSLFLVIPIQASEIHLKDTDLMMLCLNDAQCAAQCRKNTTAINGKIYQSSYTPNTTYPFSPLK